MNILPWDWNCFPLFSHFYLTWIQKFAKVIRQRVSKKSGNLLKLLRWAQRFVISGSAVQIRPWAPNLSPFAIIVPERSPKLRWRAGQTCSDSLSPARRPFSSSLFRCPRHIAMTPDSTQGSKLTWSSANQDLLAKWSSQGANLPFFFGKIDGLQHQRIPSWQNWNGQRGLARNGNSMTPWTWQNSRGRI